MERNQFDFLFHRTIFWSFAANFLFIVGMIGYLILDLIDFIYPLTNSSFTRNHFYVILAVLFVINATLHLCLVLKMNRNVKRYRTILWTCFLDQIGSYAYLLGAIFFMLNSISFNLIWLFNTIGVGAFVLAATFNLTISNESHTVIWADQLNFLGSLFYLLAVVVTQVPLTKIIVLFGDSVYLICSILYFLCWFEDHHMLIEMSDEENLLMNN